MSIWNFPIIEKLPTGIQISTIEAYDEHIYIGTQSGDLLHYFEIEVGNYLLVSRIKFDNDSSNDKNSPISKILLIPRIDKACILCNSKLVLFLLPELEPVPNLASVDTVNEIILIGTRSEEHTSELL